MVNNATINYNRLNSLTVNGGSGGNIFIVINTRANITTTLNTGTGADRTTVEATRNGSTLDINGQDSDDGVLLSDIGSAQNFNGTINVGKPSRLYGATVDDSTDNTGQSLTMDDTQLSGSLVNTAFVNYANLGPSTSLAALAATPSPSIARPPTSRPRSTRAKDPSTPSMCSGRWVEHARADGHGRSRRGHHPSVRKHHGPDQYRRGPRLDEPRIDLSNDGLPHRFDLSSDGTTSTLHDEDGNIPADITYITASLSSLEIDTDPTQDEA